MVEIQKISEIPLLAIVFAAGFVFGLIEYLFRYQRPSPFFLIGVFGLVAMSLVGFLNSRSYYFDTRFFGIDLTMFAAFIGGLVWAEARPPDAVLKRVLIWTGLSGILVLLTIIGLQVQIVPKAPIENRTLVFSLFTAGFMLFSFAPLIAAFRGRNVKAAAGIGLIVFSAILLALVMLIASFTATRSYFVAGVASCLLAGGIIWRNIGPFTRPLMILAVLGLTGAMMLSGSVQDLGALGDRLGSTDVAHEERFLELQMMFEEMGPFDFAFGKGFGVRFPSPIGNWGLAIAPHVGLFAFLLKGGIPGFIVFVIVPLILAAKKFFGRGSSALERGAAAGVLLFMVLAATSGGWQLLHLFVLGASLGVLMRVRSVKARELSRKRNSIIRADHLNKALPSIRMPERAVADR